MKRIWSEIVGTPIFVARTDRAVGRLNGAFINPETGQIIAYLVGFGRVLSPVDIDRWDPQVVRVSSNDVLVSPLEILRLEEFGLKRTLFMSKTVWTKESKFIGRLRDFTIDTATDFLVNFRVSKRFLWFEWGERILTFDKIFSIEKNRIIVTVKNGEKVKGKTAAVPA
jgi:uncharacterized protein YrrD